LNHYGIQGINIKERTKSKPFASSWDFTILSEGKKRTTKTFGRYRRSLDRDSKLVPSETNCACASRRRISISEHHRAYVTKFSRATSETIRH
jgi:hypothetical protein